MLVFTNVFDLLFTNLLNDIVFNKDDQLTLNSVAATLSFWEFSSPKTVVTKSDIIHYNQWTNYYRLLHCSSGSKELGSRQGFFPYWESNRGVGLRTRLIERKGKSSTIIWKCLNRSNSSFKSKGSVIWCRLWKSIRGRGERWCLSVLWMRMARAGAPIVETVCNSSGIFRPGNYQQA